MVVEMRSRRKLRVYFSLLLAASLALTLFEELHGRRLLYERGGFAAVLAGSLPNFLAVPIVAFAMVLVRGGTSGSARMIGAVVAGLTAYEIAQIWMPGRVFDWKDIAASVAGGLFSWVMIEIGSCAAISGDP